MSNLLKRAIFGAIYVGLILAALLLREHLVYMTVFGLLVFLGTWEWSNLVSTHRIFPLRRITDAVAAVYIFWATHEIADMGIEHAAFLIPYAGYLLYILVRSIYSERAAMPTDLAKILFGQVYVGGFLSIANIFYSDEQTSMILLAIFVCIWVNDTGAYLAGSTLGKHKLFPSVSPKKSWEGFIGGLIASTVAAGLILGWELSYYGVIISIVATWGDLFESMIKRSVGVKDSGNIIPGHGGILDRIDSLLFVLPFMAFFLWVLQTYQHLHLS